MGKEEAVREAIRKYDLPLSEAGVKFEDLVNLSIALIPRNYMYVYTSVQGVLEGRVKYVYHALTERDRTIRFLNVYPTEQCMAMNLDVRTDVNSSYKFEKEMTRGICTLKVTISFDRPLKPNDETEIDITYMIKDNIFSRKNDFLSRLYMESVGYISLQSLTSSLKVPVFSTDLIVDYFGYVVKKTELVKVLEMDDVGFPVRREPIKGRLSRTHEGGFSASFVPQVNYVTGVFYTLE